MDLKKILFGAVVVIILYIFFTTVFADKTKSNLVGEHSALDNQKNIPYGKLKGSGSTNYTYSFWIYINDYNKFYGEKKMILERSETVGDTAKIIYYPRIYLGENQNDIHIEISEQLKSNNPVTNHEIVINSNKKFVLLHINLTKYQSMYI